LKQSLFRLRQVKSPAHKRRRNCHGVPIPQKPMRLKFLHFPRHEFTVEQRHTPGKPPTPQPLRQSLPQRFLPSERC
jgi:hypothetical protein